MEEDIHKYIQTYDDNQTIDIIYHASDIHIRNDNERNDEYYTVLNNLYNILKNKKESNKSLNSIMIIVGDLFHLKTKLTPESVKTAMHMLSSISKIMPLFIIAGNHDCNMNNKHSLDSISSISIELEKYTNIYYLKESSYYHYKNIIFGVSSILDNIMLNGEDIKNCTDKIKIALYHGTLHDISSGIDGKNIKSSYFKNYDYTLLGDIHIPTYITKFIAYSGSLIQQDYSEQIEKHGIIEWNLITKNSNFINIENNYGFYNIEIKDNNHEIQILKKYPKIKFYVYIEQLYYENIINEYKTKYNINDKKNIIIINMNKTKINELFTENKKLENNISQLELITKYLNQKKYSQDVINDILNLHQTINNNISNKSNSIKSSWSILKLSFSNVLCYGSNNEILFNNYDKHKTIAIVANNHFGKSAILDIILYCITGIFSRGKTKDILNINEKKYSCILKLKYNNEIYIINRYGSKKNNSIRNNVEYYKISNKIKTILNGNTLVETNKIITETFGNFKFFISTSLFLQNNNNSFIDMSNTNRKDFLYELLGLNVFDEAFNISKEQFKTLNNNIENKQQSYNDIDYKNLKILLTNYKSELNNCIDEKNKLNNLLNEYSKKNKTIYHVDNNIFKLGNTYDEILKKLKHYEKNKLNNTNYTNAINHLNKHINKIVINNINVEKTKSDLKLSKDECIEKIKIEEKLCNLNTNYKNLDNLKNQLNIIKQKLNNIDIFDDYECYRIQGKIELLEKCFNLDIYNKHDNIKSHIQKEINKYKEQLKHYNPDNILLIRKYNKIFEEVKIMEKELPHYENLIKFKDHLKSLEYINNLKINKLHNIKNEFINKQKSYIDKNIDLNIIYNNLPILKLIEEQNNYNNNLDILYKNTYNKLIDCEKNITLYNEKINQINEQIYKYNQLNTDIEILKKKSYIYKEYLNLINHNGLPYEILKNNIPEIEKSINLILNNIVKFKVKFSLNTDNLNTTIDIDIVYNDRSYDIALICGFEKFIISIAIRIAISNFTMIPKPNFIIIDEGWSCLDDIHLNNIDYILEIFKSYFDHTILISHLPEIKNKSDYSIEIKKKHNLSYLVQ